MESTKNQTFICRLCGEVLNKRLFRKHLKINHNLNLENYLREYHPELGGYCSVCGKPTRLNNLNKGFHQFCSKKCTGIGTSDKRKETCLEKYGVEHPAKSSIVQKKIKNTWLEKYGVENILQLKDIREKQKKTYIEKHGVEYPFQLPGFQEKRKQTWLKKYGVEHPAQSPKIQEKMRNTCLEKYGVENVFQSKEIQEKQKKTNLERYGVQYSLQSKEIQEKQKKTNLERYGIEYSFRSPEGQEKLKQSSIPKWFNQHLEVCKRLDIVILESPEEWYHKEFDLDIHTHRFHCNFHNLDFESEFYNDRNLCPECRKALWSQGEREVGDYIESLGIPIIRNDRSMIKPKEIDIWIPSRNIGIEYNGEYWHQDKERDLEKKLLCESKGIRLYTIWDTEWNKNKKEVMKNIKEILV